MKARFAVGWPCFCFTIICAFHSAEKSQASLAHPSIDDSGINAVKFRCSDGSEVPPLKVWIRQVDISIIPTRSLTNHWIEVSTAEGPDGNWSSWTLCDEGELLNTKLLLPPCRRIYIYISCWAMQARASMPFGLKVTVQGWCLIVSSWYWDDSDDSDGWCFACGLWVPFGGRAWTMLASPALTFAAVYSSGFFNLRRPNKIVLCASKASQTWARWAIWVFQMAMLPPRLHWRLKHLVKHLSIWMDWNLLITFFRILPVAKVAWSKELRCPPGSAICGAQANLVKAVGSTQLRPAWFAARFAGCGRQYGRGRRANVLLLPYDQSLFTRILRSHSCFTVKCWEVENAISPTKREAAMHLWIVQQFAVTPVVEWNWWS